MVRLLLPALLLLPACLAPVSAQTDFRYEGAPVDVPDNVVAGVSLPLPVEGLGLLLDLDVRFEAPADCDGTPAADAAIRHTYIGDLVLILRSPQGTEVTLVQQRGGARDNYCAVTFDDDGGFPSITTLTSVNGQPVTGSFAPQNALSAFDGEDPNGVWNLVVSDRVLDDAGTVRRFALVVSAQAPVPIVVDVSGDPVPDGCTPGSCSLREAVTLANGRAGLDRILLPAVPVTLSRTGAFEDANASGDLDVSDDLEIIGAGAETSVVSQAAPDRMLHVAQPGVSLRLRSLRLQGSGGSASVNDGGAVSMGQGGRLVIEDSVLDGHRAAVRGGAISHFSGNDPGDPRPVLLLRRSVLRDNRTGSSGTGGALFGVASSSFDPVFYLLSEATVWENNQAGARGGALALTAFSTSSGYAMLRSSQFADNAVTNAADGRGGAVVEAGGFFGSFAFEVSDSLFEANSVPLTGTNACGGAISAGSLRIAGTRFLDNSARIGGALCGTSEQIADSTFCDNSAAEGGGALQSSNFSTRPLTIRRSTFCRNSVSAASSSQPGGGAILASGGHLTLLDSTLDGNDALRGGAISAQAGPLTLRGNSFAAANAPMPGAQATLLHHTGTVAGEGLFFTNNILIGTCSYAIAAHSSSGALRNIESPGDTCRLTQLTLSSGNLVNVSAAAINLGVLADNGGPTPTRLPAAPSVAIDNGSQAACGSTDQRGFLRVDANCDIGAVEAGAVDRVFQDGFEPFPAASLGRAAQVRR